MSIYPSGIMLLSHNRPKGVSYSILVPKRFGHQEIIDLTPNQKVSLTLVNSGPLKHLPYLDFNLRALSETQTEVTLNFVNTYQKPFQVPAKLLGIVKWTRALQIKDLEGLKTYSEFPKAL